MHGLHGMHAFWEEMYAIDLPQGFQEVVAAECDTAKQTFLLRQWDLQCLVSDVDEFKTQRVNNIAAKGDGSGIEPLPQGKFFAGGFSCQDLTKQNNVRLGNKGVVRNGGGTSGVTFHACGAYIKKMRPKISFLENVPELKQSYWVYEQLTSDTEFITEYFESDHFTVIWIDMDAARYGSPKDVSVSIIAL